MIKISSSDRCIFNELIEKIYRTFRKNIIYFNYILMYIVVTFLHTCNRIVTLIAERLLHIQINSPYLYLASYLYIKSCIPCAKHIFYLHTKRNIIVEVIQIC